MKFKRAIYFRNRLLSIRNRLLSIRNRLLSIRNRLLSNRNRAISKINRSLELGQFWELGLSDWCDDYFFGVRRRKKLLLERF
jgi:hypothetical protein